MQGRVGSIIHAESIFWVRVWRGLVWLVASRSVRVRWGMSGLGSACFGPVRLVRAGSTIHFGVLWRVRVRHVRVRDARVGLGRVGSIHAESTF